MLFVRFFVYRVVYFLVYFVVAQSVSHVERKLVFSASCFVSAVWVSGPDVPKNALKTIRQGSMAS
jgi:hypothetical protein